MISRELQLLIKEKKKALLQGKIEEAATICNQLGNLKASDLNYEEALEEHQEELTLSERLGKLDCIAVAQRRVGEMLAKMGRYSEAINHHKLYLELAENSGNSVEIQRAWATVGWTNFNYYTAIMDEEIEEPLINTEKLLSRAQFAFTSSLGCVEKLKGDVTPREYNEMKARLLLNVALIYDQRNMMQECSTSLRKAVHLCKSNNLTEDLHRCQYSLACIYFLHGEIDLANSTTDQAMNSAKALKNVTYMTDALILKSKLQLSKTDYKSGKYYAKKAYKHCLPANKEMVANILKNIIGVCTLLEKLQKAEDTEMRCKIHEQIADVFALVSCFQLAIEYYKNALTFAQELRKEDKKIASIYFSLAKTYADAHDYSKAIEHWEKEIECNEGNHLEICSTLLEIAKTQEKQGCHVDSVQKTLRHAVESARKSDHISMQYRSLEKLQNFCIRHGKVPTDDITTTLQELQEKQDTTDENETELADSLEQFLDSINLHELSDCSDSDDDNFRVAEKCSRQRRPIQIRKNEKGETPLHRACISGNLKQVKSLIQQGHPVNPRDFSGWLPIHEASNYGFKDIVEYLIDSGAWINDKGGEYCGGITPLHDAAIGGHMQLMRLLIARGASVLARNDNRQTPLDCFLEWKKEMEDDLDDNLLRECFDLQSTMRMHMTDNQTENKSYKNSNNVSMTKKNASYGWVTEHSQQEIYNENVDVKTISEMDVDDIHDDCILNNPLLDTEEITHDWDDPNVARKEFQTVMTNLRTKPLRKIEKRPDEDIDNPLHISDSWIVNDIPEKPKQGSKKRKRTLDDYMCVEKTVEPPLGIPDTVPYINDSLKDSVDSLPCRSIAVHICGETFVVPVPDSSLTFGWLSERAADSYCDTHNMKPKLTLLRKDGAIFSKSDSLSLFQDTSVNAQVDSWDDYNFLKRFSQACISLNIPLIREVEKEVSHVEDSGSADVMAGSVLSSLYLKPFLKAVKFLSTLRSLSISELYLTTDAIDALCKSIPTLVDLMYLSLKCCGLDSSKLLQITNAINNTVGCKKFQLKQLDLSFNSFGNECSIILKTLLSCFTLIENVNLSFCDLPEIFHNQPLVHVIQNLLFLKELNISGNRLHKQTMNEYLQCISQLNLCCLDLSYTFCDFNLGKSLTEHLLNFGKSLRTLILRECNLSDSDCDYLSSFIGHCTHLEELDVSFNQDMTMAGLKKIIKIATENDLPLLSLTLLGAVVQDSDNRTLFCELLQTRQLKRITFNKAMFENSDHLELIQREWFLMWGKRACMFSDDYDSITFSA